MYAYRLKPIIKKKFSTVSTVVNKVIIFYSVHLSWLLEGLVFFVLLPNLH